MSAHLEKTNVWYTLVILAVVAIASLALTGTSTAASPDLVIEDEGSAAWITNNNAFAGGHPKKWSDPGNRQFRTGLLVQLGTYYHDNESPRVEFLAVVLEKKGSEPDEVYEPGDFTWINIVSDYEIKGQSTTAPMESSHAPLLYPTPNFPDVIYCDEYPAYGCLRNRKVHHEMEVDGIITYWRGSKGFDASTDPIGTEGGLYDKHEFDFKDKFRVDVYKETNEGTADDPSWVITLVKSYAQGEITKIVIKDSGGPPNHGGKHDPTWPPAGG